MNTTAEVPASDLGDVIHQLEGARSRPYPGGSKNAWEEFKQYEAAQMTAHPFANSREAIKAFEAI